jgi:hypothetical protein
LANYRDFFEARDFVRSQNFKNRDAYWAWADTDDRPENIPANPAQHYGKLFPGWPDFLGVNRRWTSNT